MIKTSPSVAVINMNDYRRVISVNLKTADNQMKKFILKYLFRINPDFPGEDTFNSFQQMFPDATNIEWAKEKNGKFEVIFRVHGIEKIAIFEKSGKWLRTDTNYKLEMVDSIIKEKLGKYGQIMSSIYTQEESDHNRWEFIIRDNFQVRHVFITDKHGNVIERRTFDESKLI